jgi:hypothetical protein
MERSAVAWEEYLDADEPQARQRPAGRRRRWLVGGLLALLVLAALVVSAAQLLAPATPQPAPAAPTAATQPADVPATPDVTAWTWPRTGMTLPVSPTDGPQRLSDVAAGFARTELGAALAAAHLSVRVDPAAGADVFGPTIDQQMTGDTARVLAAVEAAATSPTAATGTTPSTAPAAITGYRVDAFTPDAATVHLRVVSAGGAATDFAVPVVWDGERGDWLLVAPGPQADALFATAPAGGDYVPFITEEPR